MPRGWKGFAIQLSYYVSSLCADKLPNQPHLLYKYQINMSISYFRGIWILIGINILAPYQIDRSWEVMWFQ